VNEPGTSQTLTANLDSTFAYNTEGKITSMAYPSSGPSYTYSHDTMYRLSGMKTSGGATVVNGVSYNAANQLLTIGYGTTETRTYNVLTQLATLTAQNSSGTVENLTYDYPSGANNGKLTSMYNAVSGETITYTYDSLNRLLTGSGAGGGSNWGQQYGFDAFGNLLSKTVTAGSGPSLSVSVNPANNQIQGVSGWSYDANGNASTSGMTYDAENRLATAGGLQYVYDGQNKRIWSWNGGLDGSSNPTGYSVVMYSPAGQKLATYQLTPQWLQAWSPYMWMQVTLASSDQYFGGRRLAVLDQLGSAGTYFPWGEDRGNTNPQNTWSYATYWRDSGTNLDYANNRYYSNAYGRFMTPDPYQASGGPSSPQSWNRYAYTRGDPVNRFDVSGLQDASPNDLPVAGGGGGDDDDDDGGSGGGGSGGGGIGGSVQCTISLLDRPVENGGVLNNFNHDYINIVMDTTYANGTTSVVDDVVEGLPQYGNPKSFPTLYGQLTGNVFLNFNVLDDPRDDKDHPLTDPSSGSVTGGLGSVSGGSSVCGDAVQIVGNALLGTNGPNAPGTFGPYDPSGSIYGKNGNWLAWYLLQTVGLNFPAPPNSPGYPGSAYLFPPKRPRPPHRPLQ
jgi:RHS repeat-associated protein